MNWVRAAAIAALVCASHKSLALTLSDAREMAASRTPEILVGTRKQEVAAADVRIAGALANPIFSVATARETARLSTGVSLPLPLFGQRGLAVAAATADADVIAKEYRILLRDLRWTATITWIDAWEATERAKLLETGANDAERLFEIATERFTDGSAPRLDTVRAKADAARARAESDGARLAVSGFSARLAAATGNDPAMPLDITGAPTTPALLPSLQDLMRDTISSPPIARNVSVESAAKAHVKLEQRLRFPLVSVQLTINQDDPTLKDPLTGHIPADIIAGVSFELPLLNAHGGAIWRAEADRDLAEATMAMDLAHIRADLIDVYRRTNAAGVRARAISTGALPAMEEARSMAEESYREGRADIFRVLDAQRSLTETRLADIDARATLARMFADLEKVVGQDLIGVTSAGAY